MKVTMLYFSTIAKIIEEYGYTWANVGAIQDNNDRYKYGDNNQFSCSLEHGFYTQHMGSSHVKDFKISDKLLSAFLEALKETAGFLI